jgi:hypothetical protein
MTASPTAVGSEGGMPWRTEAWTTRDVASGSVPVSLPADVAPPANRQSLPHPVVRVWNVVSPSLSREGKRAARHAHGGAGKGRRRKRTPSWSGVERGGAVGNITLRASERTSQAGRASRERVAH